MSHTIAPTPRLQGSSVSTVCWLGLLVSWSFLEFSIISEHSQTFTNFEIARAVFLHILAINSLAWTAFSLFYVLVRRFTPRRGPALLRVLCFALACAGMGLLLSVSWASFLHFGSFSSIGMLGFIWHNRGFAVMLADQADVSIWSAMIPFLLGYGTVGAWLITSRIFRATLRHGIFIADVVVLLLAASVVIFFDSRELKLGDTRFDYLKVARVATRTSPLATLFQSLLDWQREERSIVDARTVEYLLPLRASAEKWTPSPLGKNEPEVIVLVSIESLRPDVVQMVHQGKQVMPQLSLLAKNGVEFSRAYAVSSQSNFSDPTVLISLYPIRKLRMQHYEENEAWPRVNIFEIVKKLGYSTALISAQNELWGGMENAYQRKGIDLFFDSRNAQKTYLGGDATLRRVVEAGLLESGKAYDDQITSLAIDFINKNKEQGKRSFVVLNYQASHFPYIDQGNRGPFEPAFIPEGTTFNWYPPESKPPVFNAYLNSIHSIDGEIARLTKALESKSLLEKSAIVVYGDNGEAFHDHGFVAHANVPLENQIRVGLVMFAPQLVKPRVEDYPFSLIDIAPTLLGILGQKPYPVFQGIDAFSPSREPAPQRMLFGLVNAVLQVDAMVLGNGLKILRNPATDEVHIYDLKSDPAEEKELYSPQDKTSLCLKEVITRWRDIHLAYYHQPILWKTRLQPLAETIRLPCLASLSKVQE